MRFLRVLALPLVAVGVLACGDDDGGPTAVNNPPLAFVRYVHAVPDAGPTDFRFIDQVANSPAFFNQAFRSFTPYQGAEASSNRRLRIFPTSTNIDVTSVPLVDTTLNLEAGRYYTILHTGRANGSPAQRLEIIEDVFPAPGSVVNLRIVHAAAGVGAVDVYDTATDSTPVAGSPLASGLAYLQRTGYLTRSTGAFALRVAPAGSTTPAGSAPAPEGLPGNAATLDEPIGGYGQPGTIMTAFIMPASVPGSAAPQGAAFQQPRPVFIVDRNPPMQ